MNNVSYFRTPKRKTILQPLHKEVRHMKSQDWFLNKTMFSFFLPFCKPNQCPWDAI